MAKRSILYRIILITALALISLVIVTNYSKAEQNKFFCELLMPGQGLDEVKGVLDNVGDYRLSEYSVSRGRYYVYFKGSYISRIVKLGTLSTLNLVFDENGNLIRVQKLVNVSNWAQVTPCEEE